MIVAPPIQNHRMWAGFDLWAQQAIDAMPLERMLVYFVDTVDVAVLPYLAKEFDVEGKKGWDFCTTEAAQRTLIKSAIQLHRYKGTPWAIEQVIQQSGLINGVLVESCGTDPSTGWAVFRIDMSLDDLLPDAEQLALAELLLNIYKNARSVLYGIVFSGTELNESNDMLLDDIMVVNAHHDLGHDDASMNASIIYDGTITYGEGYDHTGELDSLIIY